MVPHFPRTEWLGVSSNRYWQGTCSPPSEKDTSSVLDSVKATRSASLIYVKPYVGRANILLGGQ